MRLDRRPRPQLRFQKARAAVKESRSERLPVPDQPVLAIAVDAPDSLERVGLAEGVCLPRVGLVVLLNADGDNSEPTDALRRFERDDESASRGRPSRPATRPGGRAQRWRRYSQVPGCQSRSPKAAKAPKRRAFHGKDRKLRRCMTALAEVRMYRSVVARLPCRRSD